MFWKFGCVVFNVLLRIGKKNISYPFRGGLFSKHSHGNDKDIYAFKQKIVTKLHDRFLVYHEFFTKKDKTGSIQKGNIK